MTERHALQVLADITATPKEVAGIIKDAAERSVLMSLSCRSDKRQARVQARVDCESLLESRYFSRYRKKQTLDKVISKAMRNYNAQLSGRLRDDLADAEDSVRSWEEPPHGRWRCLQLGQERLRVKELQERLATL